MSNDDYIQGRNYVIIQQARPIEYLKRNKFST
jgi:hypothetical protein